MRFFKTIMMLVIVTMFIYVVVERDKGIGTVFNQNRTVVGSQPKPYTGAKNDEDYSYLLQVGDMDDGIMKDKRTAYEEEADGAVRIVISVAGDCTLGRDDSYSYDYSFMHEYEQQNNDSSYFMRNVAEIFGESDFTIVNLEGPLTDSVNKADKEFAFKGLPEFTDILKSGNIDAVSLANNHIKDYSMEGYHDTIANLEKASIMYFGNENVALAEVKGLKIGMYGYSTWYIDNGIKKNIAGSINKLRDMGANIIIGYFHWGDENTIFPNEAQVHYARFAVDNGTDLVLGSHPHVIQGIEEYKGKQIVYSLGNFSFGGNRNPADKDSYIFQQIFTFKDGQMQENRDIRIIPVSISSIGSRNNFQPTPLEGDERERVAKKIIERSFGANAEEILRNALQDYIYTQ